MHRFKLLLLLLLMLTVIACGGESAPETGATASAAGQVDAGESLFSQTLAATQPGCITCHSLEPGVRLVGPSLANIGAEAGSRVSGQSAEDYLRASIVAPNDYVVEGFGAIMPATYSTELLEEQIRDLVAYMRTLK